MSDATLTDLETDTPTVPPTAENGANGFTSAQDKTLSQRLSLLATKKQLQDNIQGIHTKLDNLDGRIARLKKSGTKLNKQMRRLELRQAVLERHTKSLEGSLQKVEQELASLRDKIDERMDGLRDKMDERMDGLHREISGLRDKMDERMDGLRDKMDERLDSMRQEMTSMNTKIDTNAYRAYTFGGGAVLFLSLLILTSNPHAPELIAKLLSWLS